MADTINTEFIEYVVEKHNKGQKLTRKENIFYNKIPGTLKPGYLYAYTDEEIIEYTKCANDIIYFIEKYCKIQSYDGKLVNFKLHNYQKEILKSYEDNKFLIFMNSRQIGFSQLYACIYLHYMLFNVEKGILSIHNKLDDGISLINKIKTNYLHLPYFLKKGVRVMNSKNLTFDNYSRIKIDSRSKELAIGSNYDIYHIHDFAHIPPNIIDNILKNLFPCVGAIKHSKLIISSTPNGKNLFKILIEESELKEGHPDKNAYKTVRTYWWEVPGRDNEWKEEQIKMLGSREAFDQEYDLKFLS